MSWRNRGSIRRRGSGRRLGLDGCLDARSYTCLDGGLGVESPCGDLRVDGGLYIDLRVVAASRREYGGRYKRGQKELAHHAESCI